MTLAIEEMKIGARKVRADVAKWENGRTPEDGPPDAVVSAEQWQYEDGSVLTDPVIIAECERRLAAAEEQA